MSNPPQYNHSVQFQNTPYGQSNLEMINPQLSHNDTANQYMVAQLRRLEIDNKGRHPVTVYCDTCNAMVTTTIKEEPSAALAKYAKLFTYSLFGSLALMLIFPVFLMNGVTMSLMYIAGVYGILAAVFFFVMTFIIPCNACCYKDIHHNCPNCRSFFGTNDAKRHAHARR